MNVIIDKPMSFESIVIINDVIIELCSPFSATASRSIGDYRLFREADCSRACACASRPFQSCLIKSTQQSSMYGRTGRHVESESKRISGRIDPVLSLLFRLHQVPQHLWRLVGKVEIADFDPINVQLIWTREMISKQKSETCDFLHVWRGLP